MIDQDQFKRILPVLPLLNHADTALLNAYKQAAAEIVQRIQYR